METEDRPRIGGLLESALYVDDMERSVEFFGNVLGLRSLVRGERLTAFDAGRQGVLLLFARGRSAVDMPSPNGIIPGHDGSGPLHVAFAISADRYDGWLAHLARSDVPIVSEVRWPRGGRSCYFHDPDGHLVELATPGLWETY
jgi:catechol 2,3-dioxygenase-like lactoylglutathione lyase family enzyme